MNTKQKGNRKSSISNRQYSILLVDDDPFILKTIGPALESKGYQITTADSGDGAIELIPKKDFDLIITDLVMEPTDGIAVLKNSKRISPKTMVMLLTGFGDMTSSIDALRLGADDYLLKPCEGEEIFFRVSRCLEKLTLEREIRRAEKTLRESEKMYRTLFKHASDHIFLLDPAHKDGPVIVDVNDTALAAYGYSREEFIGKTTSSIITEESRKHIAERVQRLMSGEALIFEDKRVRKDGSIFQAEVSARRISIAGRPHIYSIQRDISDRKRMENLLIRSQKLESVGTLAGGIAHDFNNLLSVIMGNIEMAKGDIKPEIGVSMNLKEAEKASGKAQELTTKLITFSKGGEPYKKTGPIGDLIIESTEVTLSGSSSNCEFSIPEDLWLVEFDEGQIKHAFKNLIVNAVEAMPDGGTIHVRAQNLDPGTGTEKSDSALTAGRYVKLTIHDQGVGISEGNLSRIFDPYFSTKELGIEKGMGLGLATTYSIINKHGGHITIESEVGAGTTVHICLPAKEAEGIAHKEKQLAVDSHTSVKRVLVMDDEEMIRDLTKQMLGRFDCDVEVAKDGNEAIELYRNTMDAGEPFDLVILDLTIKGGMGGKIVIKELQKIDPDVKAIVSSGYSNDPVITNFSEYGFMGALAKPYAMKQLGDALSKFNM